jgi:hypothetical protein
MKFKYELIKAGLMPTFEPAMLVDFINPVHVGDKIKPEVIGAELVKVVAIEHYSSHSIIYHE